MSRRVLLIVNPMAGSGRTAAALPAVEGELARLGVEFHTELTRSIEHARELVAAAKAAEETPVGFSGDGLIGAVAAAVSDTGGGVMGVLPGGRGNDLARVLEIPFDPVAACTVIAKGVERIIDLAEVDGRAYACIASCGFDSDANRIANETTLVKGNLVYAYAGVAALLKWKPARFVLEVDGRPISFSGYSVAAANSKAYGGGMLLAPDADLEDGLLDLVLTGEGSKRRFLMGLPEVFKGTHVNLPSVHIERAREVKVSADRPFDVYADGDVIAQLPVTIRARPKALSVLVPA